MAAGILKDVRFELRGDHLHATLFYTEPYIETPTHKMLRVRPDLLLVDLLLVAMHTTIDFPLEAERRVLERSMMPESMMPESMMPESTMPESMFTTAAHFAFYRLTNGLYDIDDGLKLLFFEARLLQGDVLFTEISETIDDATNDAYNDS